MGDRAWAAVVVVTVGVSFCLGLGWVPLFDKDEAAFSQATREMIASGNYLMTYLNGEPRYDKPILIYWFQALSVHAFGLNEFALRLPSGIAAALWALFLWLFMRTRGDAADSGTRREALLAVFILATSVQITIIAKAAIADALLNACIAGSMFAFWRHHETGRAKHLYLAFAAMALGTLTKGPVAIYVPVVTMLSFGAFQGAFRVWLRRALHPGGWALFVLVALPWPLLAFLDQGMPLLQDWYRHTFGRMGAPMEGHGGSVFYYVPVVLLGLMPWTALFLKNLAGVRDAWRDPFRQFLWLWFIGVFVIVSLMGTKLPHYVIYGYTPLCILMAQSLAAWRRDAWILLPGALLGALFILIPLLGPWLIPLLRDDWAERIAAEALPLFTWRYHLPFAAGLAVVGGLALARGVPRDLKMVALGWTFTLLINFHVMPFVSSITQAPIREAALIAKRDNLEVVKWKLNMPSFIFYRGAFVEDRLAAPGEVIVTRITELEKIYDEYEVLYYDKGIVLARVLHVIGT